MKKREYLAALFLFLLIAIGLWSIDYLKSENNIEITQPKAYNLKKEKEVEADKKTMLLKRAEPSPISYIADEPKSILVDLSAMKVFLLKNGLVENYFEILHKGPRHLWFQSPTNYFRVGAKYNLLRSSIVDVFMPYSVQFHQDFFIHGIPYYPSGEEVNSQFSGGCLRVSNENAKQIYDFAEYGMRFIVFDQSVPKEKIKEGFSSPIDPEKYWIRQDFNSPLKIHGEYLQHAGVDMSTNSPEPVMSIYDGEVAKIQIMGNDDFGFGNTVIIKHIIEDREFYSLYAHLETISQNIYAGKEVKSGEQIGLTGASGYGCQNYWRIGDDGCNASGYLDRHLHFEIKSAPTLTNSEGENDCIQKTGLPGPCFGYVPVSPLKYGYYDPIKILTAGF